MLHDWAAAVGVQVPGEPLQQNPPRTSCEFPYRALRLIAGLIAPCWCGPLPRQGFGLDLIEREVETRSRG